MTGSVIALLLGVAFTVGAVRRGNGLTRSIGGGLVVMLGAQFVAIVVTMTT